MNIDVFDLPNVSAQKVAETIATHMLKQAARSTDRTLCVYKNPDGLMCAAGVLFDSERCTDLRLSCEGMSWGACGVRPCAEEACEADPSPPKAARLCCSSALASSFVFLVCLV